MRRAAFFGFLLAAYYLAAMYRSQPLMALCLGMFLLAGTAFFQARRLRQGLSASFLPKRKDMIQGKADALLVRVTNRCPLGTGRCVLTLEIGYGEGEKPYPARLEIPVQYGETDLEASLLPPYCGLLSLHITTLEGRDHISLFRFKKPWNVETVLPVFPPAGELNIVFSSLEGHDRIPRTGPVKEALGENIHEIRQLREYRIGDQIRRIHWNLSARTGGLWLKDPEGDEPLTMALYLAGGDSVLSLSEKSRFFRLFYALALGLLGQSAGLEVSWRDWEGHTICERAADQEGVRRLLLLLYRTGLSAKAPAPEERRGSFVLDTEMRWYWEETLIYRFSPNALEKEIQEKIFWL